MKRKSKDKSSKFAPSIKRNKTVSSTPSTSNSSENFFNRKIENKVEFNSFLDNIKRKRNKYFTGFGTNSFNSKRIKIIRGSEESVISNKSILYWMSRDQRVQDNWAFHYAQKLSLKFNSNFHVCFCLVPKFLDATIRHYDFLLKGLQEVEKECRQLNINFHLLFGSAKNCIPKFVEQNKIGVVVNDFCPLRLPLQWIKEVSESLPGDIYICQVDAHNVVPVWNASPKLEVGARTIRSKINGKLNEFLTEFPPIIKHPDFGDLSKPVDWELATKSLDVDMTVKEVPGFVPGYQAGIENLWKFIYSKRLVDFNLFRNNPTKSCLSNISPWLHFGQISAQRCILEVQTQKSRAKEGVDIFTEESLVRRELADNFCYYNQNYDVLLGASNWARETLETHRNDERPYKYTLEQLDSAKTHDNLWNGAQIQMVKEGKMHGFLRMYWAKKILEWTEEGPEEALKRAIWLNDRYSIDGRDPNGYTGIMWSICGIHDQGWAERAVFGKVRYMNYKGCQRKFDVELFEKTYRRPK